MKKTTLFLLTLTLSLLLFSQGTAEKQMQSSDFYRATDANGRTLLLEKKTGLTYGRGKSRCNAGKCALSLS